MLHLRGTHGSATFAIAAVLSLSLAAAASPPGIVIEGESRSRDAKQCAPDGESMRVVSDPGSSGGQALEFPHDGCWAEYARLLGDGATGYHVYVGSISPGGGGSGVTECVSWVLELDGAGIGSTASHCGSGGVSSRDELLLDGGIGCIPLGFHTIRVTMDVTQGPAYANAYVDYLKLVPLAC